LDFDEPLAVGKAGIKPQRVVARDLDPHNRQFLDAPTNPRTKHTRIAPKDPRAAAGPGQPEIADPSVLFERRFDEVAELKQIFDDAVSRVKNYRELGPTKLKARINDNIKDIIKNGQTDAGRKVRDALDSLGFEFTEKGLTARK